MPIFSGAILRHADLRGASLRFATLDGADLEGADLTRADLAHARLAHANLAGANLSDAVLDYADFAGADLSQADLSGARLHNVRNLLASQLEETLGDAATILPSHLQGCVPWSAAGDEPRIPLLDPAEFWLLQARRDLRRRTFYGQTMRVAGALRLAPWSPPASSPRRRTTRCLPARVRHRKVSSHLCPCCLQWTSKLRPSAWRPRWDSKRQPLPPSLATIRADLVSPAAPAPSAIVEPADAPVPSEAADPSSETISAGHRCDTASRD